VRGPGHFEHSELSGTLGTLMPCAGSRVSSLQNVVVRVVDIARRENDVFGISDRERRTNSPLALPRAATVRLLSADVEKRTPHSVGSDARTPPARNGRDAVRAILLVFKNIRINLSRTSSAIVFLRK